MRMHGQVALVAVVIGVLVAGCTTDAGPADPTTAEPKATTTPTGSPTPTPSPTPDVTVPPDRPEAMATPSADGAAAAASYFISLYPYAYATGDLTEWRSIADPSCEFCSKVSEEIDELHGRGHSVIGPLHVASSSGIELEAGRWYSAEVIVEIAESSELDRDGQVLSTDGAGVYRTTYSLTWDDGWRVDAVGLEPAES
ncbi:hypothetical protein H9657_01855 [Cellulomonas sp. Sa3CUA2]|uniref:DUF6318 domain-containing protein n=1 Tax=Cellulomonas avistercoris TaxID=2762242 RepID=A0ABR8Q9B8_9CELL|nr:DUF6318 family protein [Cellulomonas avistercoris]MBD7917026.1 hypothetical protein [Cellulomonas avistercoris]